MILGAIAWESVMIALIGALAGGGSAAALLKTWVRRRVDAAEARQMNMTTDLSLLEGSKQVIAIMQQQMDNMEEDIRTLQQRVKECEEDRWRMHIEMKQLQHKLAMIAATPTLSQTNPPPPPADLPTPP